MIHLSPLAFDPQTLPASEVTTAYLQLVWYKQSLGQLRWQRTIVAAKSPPPYIPITFFQAGADGAFDCFATLQQVVADSQQGQVTIDAYHISLAAPRGSNYTPKQLQEMALAAFKRTAT